MHLPARVAGADEFDVAWLVAPDDAVANPLPNLHVHRQQDVFNGLLRWWQPESPASSHRSWATTLSLAAARAAPIDRSASAHVGRIGFAWLYSRCACLYGLYRVGPSVKRHDTVWRAQRAGRVVRAV